MVKAKVESRGDIKELECDALLFVDLHAEGVGSGLYGSKSASDVMMMVAASVQTGVNFIKEKMPAHLYEPAIRMLKMHLLDILDGEDALEEDDESQN